MQIAKETFKMLKLHYLQILNTWMTVLQNYFPTDTGMEFGPTLVTTIPKQVMKKLAYSDII